jgi:hypothetical protein
MGHFQTPYTISDMLASWVAFGLLSCTISDMGRHTSRPSGPSILTFPFVLSSFYKMKSFNNLLRTIAHNFCYFMSFVCSVGGCYYLLQNNEPLYMKHFRWPHSSTPTHICGMWRRHLKNRWEVVIMWCEITKIPLHIGCAWEVYKKGCLPIFFPK